MFIPSFLIHYIHLCSWRLYSFQAKPHSRHSFLFNNGFSICLSCSPNLWKTKFLYENSKIYPKLFVLLNNRSALIADPVLIPSHQPIVSLRVTLIKDDRILNHYLQHSHCLCNRLYWKPLSPFLSCMHIFCLQNSSNHFSIDIFCNLSCTSSQHKQLWVKHHTRPDR